MTPAKRVMVVFGTRPEAIKLAPVVRALARTPQLQPVVVVTAQHRHILDQVLELFGIRPDETHAALKTTVKRYRDLELTLRVRTIRQLRQHGAANPWETAWVIWHYQDDRTFYYLTLKPNGWEIGKRDPAYQGDQRFLASDKVPVYYFNTWYDVRIVQVGDTIAVWANGMALARFRDLESAYRQGRVGLYVEDAYAQFADVNIEPARAAALGRLSPW